MGELPNSGDSITDAAIIIGHEFGHVVKYKHHSPITSSNHDVESDVIHNWENHFRAAAGLSPRTTHLGRKLNPNKSLWKSFKDFWKDIWGKE